MERSVLGIMMRDEKNCKWVREETKVDIMIEKFKALKWQWAGHM